MAIGSDLVRFESAEEALVRKASEGDRHAFETLVERHQKHVYRTALAILRDPSEADSATQDAFVRAWMSLKRFEARSTFETWITRIVVNASRDRLRQKNDARLVSADEYNDKHATPDRSPGIQRDLESRELVRIVASVVNALPERQRVIFRLRHEEERSLEDIAALLGISAATARVHLFRATSAVRNALEGKR